MSTRYVWNKQNVSGEDSTSGLVEVVRGRYSLNFDSTTVVGYCCSQIVEVKDASGNLIGWQAGGQITPLYFGGFVGTTSNYHYFVADRTGTLDTYGGSAYTGYYWYGTTDYLSGGGKYGGANVLDDRTTSAHKTNIANHVLKYKGGTLIGKVSNASNSAYPTTSGGGKKDDYWYTYLGSDNIDPTAISYPTAQVRPGDSVTVSVAPRSNTYGGTISYLYQYSVNNGNSWVTIQTTAAASINFTIPANAKSIQFRAQAQDDMGFTSTTYVTGAAVALERLNLWVGVKGKAQKGVEMYVGVDGKARKVTAAYIGVNGKARRFL